MKFYKYFIIITLMLLSTQGFSQTGIKKSSISSAGGTATANNTTIIFSIGETAIQENTQGSIHLSEGFIGTDLRQVLGIDDYELFNEFKVFPNPISAVLYINFNKSSEYTIQISDLNGRMIIVENSNKLSNSLDISMLSKGTYLLILKDNTNSKYNVLKIQKN